MLEMLVANGPSYGLQLVTESKGQLKRGTVYVTLGRMEEKGYVESEPDPEAADHLVLPRRIYRPSGYGLKVLEAWEAMRRVLELGPAHRAPAVGGCAMRPSVPGWRLRALVVNLFDQATATRVLLPAIADLQHEIAQADGRGRAARAMLRCRVYVAIWWAIGACLVARIEGERAAWWRVLASGGLVLVVTTAILMSGPVSTLSASRLRGLLPLLLPQALAMALPFSVLGAGFLAIRRCTTARGCIRPVLSYTAVAFVCALVVTVWAVPSANQEYRLRAYQILWTPADLSPRNAVPAKGYPEMTVSELREARRRLIVCDGTPRMGR